MYPQRRTRPDRASTEGSGSTHPRVSGHGICPGSSPSSRPLATTTKTSFTVDAISRAATARDFAQRYLESVGLEDEVERLPPLVRQLQRVGHLVVDSSIWETATRWLRWRSGLYRTPAPQSPGPPTIRHHLRSRIQRRAPDDRAPRHRCPWSRSPIAGSPSCQTKGLLLGTLRPAGTAPQTSRRGRRARPLAGPVLGRRDGWSWSTVVHPGRYKERRLPCQPILECASGEVESTVVPDCQNGRRLDNLSTDSPQIVLRPELIENRNT